MKALGKTSIVNAIGLIVALLVVFGYFSLRMPQTFPVAGNLETMARQTTITGIAALGMTYIIVSGGIDLSVGSTVAFVTVVIAALLRAGASPLLALLGGVCAGGGVGLVNGLLITKLRVGAFIVTLGSLGLVRGVAKWCAHEQKIDAPLTWLNKFLSPLDPGMKWMILPWGVWLTIVLAILTAFMLRGTVFGRNVLAVGGNEQAARYSGLPVDRIKLMVYVMGGLFVGLAGLMQFSRLTVGDPTVATGLELDVIAAVVIGGASLSGGEGSIFGTVLGALLMTVIRSGSSQIGWPNFVQEIVTGAIIVVSVTLDRLRVRRSSV